MEKQQKKHEEEALDDYSLIEFSQQESKKKRRIRSLLLLLFNMLIIGIIIVVEVTSNSQKVPITNVLKTWGENWIYIVAAFILVSVVFTALALKFYALIKTTTGRHRFRLSYSTAVLGKYYDLVTPFGTGGQPFQMFNLKRKLDIGLATSLPIASYIVHEFVSVFIQIILFATSSHVMKGNSFMAGAAYFGLIVFAAPPVTILLFSLFPKVIMKIARFICKVGHKLHLVKDVEKAEQKAISGVQRYSETLKFVCKKWHVLIILVILSAIASWGSNSVPFLVLKACGIENVSYIETVTMAYYVQSAITIIPTPGGAGAAELSFSAIFKSLTGPYLFWGIMLWRFFVYYLTLIIGFGVTIYQYIHAARKRKLEGNALQLKSGNVSTVTSPEGKNSIKETGGEYSADSTEKLSQENDATPENETPNNKTENES